MQCSNDSKKKTLNFEFLEYLFHREMYKKCNVTEFLCHYPSIPSNTFYVISLLLKLIDLFLWSLNIVFVAIKALTQNQRHAPAETWHCVSFESLTVR